MTWKCNFSFKHYFEVLDYAKEKYSIGSIMEFPRLKKKERFILLRHDIDFSLEYALKMAQAEAEHGLHATYFVLLHSPFYNALSEQGVSVIKIISDLGHEIGLHYDTRFLAKSSIKAAAQLEQEAQMLGNITGKKIISVTRHNITTTPKLKMYKISGFLDARGPEISVVSTYISDSVQNWRRGCMHNHIDKKKKLQFLTHPIWWTEDHKTREVILNEFEKDESKRLHLNFEFTRQLHTRYLKELKTIR